MKFVSLVCLLLVGSALAHESIFDRIRSVLGFHGDEAPTPVEALKNVAAFIESYVPAGHINAMRVAAESNVPKDDIPGPEFRWIPSYVGSGKTDGSVATWSAPCFQNSSVKVTSFSATSVTLVFDVQNPTSLLCSDWYLIGTVEQIQFASFFTHGEHTVTWNFASNVRPAELNDIKRNGFRVFRFLDNQLTSLYQLYETVMMFLPGLLNKAVPASSEQQNVNFLTRTVGFTVTPRTTKVVPLDESLVQSGDMFGIIRMDGLDPMLAWAMGAHTGHVTIALRIGGQLQVCESTTNSSYWPTNGIQCTPYGQWIQQAIAASYNLVHLPIRPDLAAKFNSTAAYMFFKENEGLNYGYGNLLWAWIDNLGNYMYPLTPELHALLPALASKIYRPVADLLWLQAFNLRAGTVNLDAAEVYDAAYTQYGWDFVALSSAPEQDSYRYIQKHNSGATVSGRSMVCDVFVCEMWKAGGLFGDMADKFQCTEATNWDIYALNMFNGNWSRPAACVAADPDLPYCQLAGNWRVDLPSYNSRSLPANAFANCPRGDAPVYDKPYPC
eukprot:TRINITY_DN470_c0_g1_i9.p1 TRINITY_DN470_c0_g1~~TRINITY_DN470_c0_g1_i9.p1  ORF type:complete len:554 (-),score=229.23 TRINITY_DN470_c0_g1_i9:215-1876(-)